jgi:uncharacterized membrane protein
MFLWGTWTFLAKIATRSLAPEVAMVVSYAASVTVALGYVFLTHDGVSLSPRGTVTALAAGVFAGGGAIAFYAGLEAGETGVVATVSALYFVVAALLGVVVLGESVGPREAVGVALAVGAVALLAG